MNRSSVFSIGVLCTLAFTHSTYGIDNKRNTDVIWHNGAQDVNTIWFLPEFHWYDLSINLASTTNTIPGGFGTNGWHIAATADFNRDGATDLLWRNVNTGDNAIWLMKHDSTGTNSNNTLDNTVLLPRVPTEWTIVGTGDFDGDGYPDILWRDQALNYTSIWYGPDFTRNASINLYPDSSWRAVAVGDFNNDTRADILWQNDTYRYLVYWYMDNTTLLSSSVLSSYPSESGWTAVGAGPFDILGNSDLFFNRTNGMNAVWMMVGTNMVQFYLLPTVTNNQFGGTGPDYANTQATELSAVPSSSPRGLTLSWRRTDGKAVTVRRRSLGAATWTNLQSGYLPYRLTNTDLKLGQRYEYQLINSNGMSETLFTAINGTPIENRGQVILVVANNVTNALASQLETFRADLVGDGWAVVRTNVPPHNDKNWSSNVVAITSIKHFITNTYFASPVTNRPQAVILIGHVPIPHSGWHDPDHHGYRCLPADTYYGDVDGRWTDTQDYGNCTLCGTGDCSCGGCDLQRHSNIVGDGKWDQHWIPSGSKGIGIELAVGRIDCANLPAFKDPGIGLSETALLKRYLTKDHRYRFKTVVLQERIMTGSYFDPIDQFNRAQPGLKFGSRLFGLGAEKNLNGDAFYPANGCTWAVNSGYGAASHMQGSNYLFHAVISTNNLTTMEYSFIAPGTEPQGGFYMLYGSCFVDHAYANNLLRGLIAASTNFNLGAMWFDPSLADYLAFERLGLGETVGSEFVRTISSNNGSAAATYYNWIGDPTLRLQILGPPTGLKATRNGSNVNLVWTASKESPPPQYFAYRSLHSLDGPFLRITAGAISSSFFTDTNAPAGTNTYMVRAIGLRTTGSGSYTNLSQGIFVTTN